MPFPTTRRELKEAGYDFMANKICPCGARMELWHTPKDQVMPMNPMNDDEAKSESHFSTCSKAAQFRRKPAASTSDAAAPGRTPPAQPSGAAQPSATKSQTPPPARQPNGRG